jgi:hypothetical protein
MTWNLWTPGALAVVGAVELVGGLIDIVAPKRLVAGLSPAEAAVLPLIGQRSLGPSAQAASRSPLLHTRTRP